MKTDEEWIKAVLQHQPGGPVPYNFMFSPVARRNAEDHYGQNLEEALQLPLRMTGLNSVKPLYADPKDYGETVEDEFGVVWSTSPIDRGAPIRPCLKQPKLTGYAFPNPHEEGRFTSLGAWCPKQRGHYRIIWVGDLWERATFMRGMEDLLLDVMVNTGFVEELLDRLTAYILQTMDLLLARFEFEAIAVSDDYGAQNAMVVSPSHWRRLIKPCLNRIYSMAKIHRRQIFHHSCGNITPIIGDLIDLGLDILHPIQPEAMDIHRLKKEDGKDVTVCGGIPPQGLLRTATPEQIKEEVCKLKRTMGAGGGYILEPGITLQADIPPSNIFAVIDEARLT
jgi:uroporphyrinogen decarboxylase